MCTLLSRRRTEPIRGRGRDQADTSEAPAEEYVADGVAFACRSVGDGLAEAGESRQRAALDLMLVCWCVVGECGCTWADGAAVCPDSRQLRIARCEILPSSCLARTGCHLRRRVNGVGPDFEGRQICSRRQVSSLCALSRVTASAG